MYLIPYLHRLLVLCWDIGVTVDRSLKGAFSMPVHCCLLAPLAVALVVCKIRAGLRRLETLGAHHPGGSARVRARADRG